MDPSKGIVTSPEHRKPKKQRLDAAQSILQSHDSVASTQTFLICRKTIGVISNLMWVPDNDILFAPFKTYFNCGICSMRGSPKPILICSCLTPARYDFIVPEAKPPL